MKRKYRNILIGTAIGIIIGLLISIPLGSIVWFRTNPSLSEVQTVMEETMDLNEAESEEMNQLLIVGSVIDFVLRLSVYVIPITCITGLLGLAGGFAWYYRQQDLSNVM